MDCNTLRSLVECPICFEVRKDCHYYLCSNNCSVSVCQVCFEKMEVKRCPQCDGDYDLPEPKRNRTVEKLIENSFLELACKYTRHGCGFACAMSRLSTHELSCPFRIVSCTYHDCDEKTCANRLEHHVESCHIGCVNFGCKFNSEKEILEEHQLECLYREVSCPAYECKDQMQVMELTRHFKVKHKDAALWKKLDESGQCSLEKDALQGDKIFLLEYDEDTIFVAKVARSEFETVKGQIGNEEEKEIEGEAKSPACSLYSIWVQVIGSQKRAGAMKVVFKAMGDEAEIRKRCKVYPIDELDEDLVMASDDTFQITEKQLRQCNEKNQSGGNIIVMILKNLETDIKEEACTPIAEETQKVKNYHLQYLLAFSCCINVTLVVCLALAIMNNSSSLILSSNSTINFCNDVKLSPNSTQSENATDTSEDVNAEQIPLPDALSNDLKVSNVNESDPFGDETVKYENKEHRSEDTKQDELNLEFTISDTCSFSTSTSVDDDFKTGNISHYSHILKSISIIALGFLLCVLIILSICSICRK